MDKQTYFKSALKSGAFMKKDWVLTIFTNVVDGLPKSNNLNQDAYAEENKGDYPYRIYEVLNDPDYFYFIDPEKNFTLNKIDGVKRGAVLFEENEYIELNPGDLPNIQSKINTRYMTAVINACLLVYPFKDKIPYTQKRIGSWLDKEVAKRADVMSDPNKRDETKIQVNEIIKYHRACSYVRSLTQICTPSMSAKAITPSPNVRALRDRLLEENKDKLNDPSVVIGIMNQIAELDKKELEGDPAAKFYMGSGKSFNINRMKALNFYGLEYGFGEKDDVPVLFKNSLDERLSLDEMPAIVDSSRFGSYSRGYLTAQGGARVKYAGRLFQNSRIIIEDCGTKHGIPWTIDEAVISQLINRYRLDERGATELLTEEFLKANIGKKIIVRSPQLCIAEAPSYCAHCLDKFLPLRPDGLFLAAMEVSSIFMNTRMKAMHGKQRSTQRLDLDIAFGY